MRQLDILKKDLAKQYDINIEEFLSLYADGVKLKDIVTHFCTSLWNIKMVASTLNLRMAQKYRSGDSSMLDLRSNDKADDSLVEKVKEQASALEQMSHDYVTQAKALIRTRHQTNMLRKSLRRESAGEGVYNLITDVVKDIEPIKRPKPMVRPQVDGRGKVQFAVLSDLHCEELVATQQVPSGEYSWDIMSRRVRKVFESLLQFNPGVNTLDIYILGDMINGFIHGSDVNATKHPIVALTDLSELLAEQLASISHSYDEVRIFTTTGNHDRLDDNPSILNKSYDFSFLLYKLIEAHLVNYTNVNMDISESGIALAEVGKDRDVSVGLSHGDQVTAGRGATSDLKTLEFFRGTLGVDVHHLIQGHFHVPSIQALGARGFSLTNGSLIGPGNYSHVKGFIPTPWSQYVGLWGTSGNLEAIHIVGD